MKSLDAWAQGPLHGAPEALAPDSPSNCLTLISLLVDQADHRDHGELKLWSYEPYTNVIGWSRDLIRSIIVDAAGHMESV